MKKLVIILAVIMAACNSEVKTSQQEKENEHEQQTDSTEISLNNGSKWKADEATKQNVAAMMQVVTDTTYAASANRKQLHQQLQLELNTLVKECKMKGPEHDALHVWLEKVMDDIRELKDEDDAYDEVLAALKKDIAAFYTNFE